MALCAMTATGREHFAWQDSAVSQIFILIIPDGEKVLSNVNVVVWRQVLRENISLPFAVRVLKSRVLKLPTIKLQIICARLIYISINEDI